MAEDATARRKGWLERFGILAVLLIFAALVGLRLVYAPFWAPSGSMKPTIIPGDYFVARSVDPEDLERGDVIVFRHPTLNANFFKRLIALPGDEVWLSDGRLHINGEAVTFTDAGAFEEVYTRQGPNGSFPICRNTPSIEGSCEKELWTETLPGGRTYDVLNVGDTAFDSTPVFSVTDGQYFVLGDNRDNSLDSRTAQPNGVGFVPAENIHFRAERILFSFEGASPLAFWTWREGRYFKAIH